MSETTLFEVDLSRLTADELAALLVALRQHITHDRFCEIRAAGYANCGAGDFYMLIGEVAMCHNDRIKKAQA